MILGNATVVVHSSGRVEVQIPESVFPYNPEERKEWRQASCSIANRINDPKHKGLGCLPINATAMNDILQTLDLGGPTILNKDRGAFYHQPECHFCEMKLAVHLVASEGFSPSELYYENWRISSLARAFQAPVDRMQCVGAERVRERLGPDFLDEMSALIDRNSEAKIDSFFPDQHVAINARVPTHDDHVDIFGYSGRHNRCAIVEVKRENERFAGHQAILLAFAAYLLKCRGTHLGLAPDLVAYIGFVRFCSSPRKDRTCRVCFQAA